MSSIKLYFCKCYENDETEIVVHRDLNLLRSEWESSDKAFVGIIHAGFCRPRFTFSSSGFWRFQGKVLVSPAVLWSLPGEYECSKAVVGELCFSKVNTPLHLVLKGLGYQEEEPQNAIDSSRHKSHEKALINSVLKTLNDSPSPLTVDEIFARLCEQNLYSFSSVKPVTALNRELDKFTENVADGCIEEAILFGKIGEKYYSLENIPREMKGWVLEFSTKYPTKTRELKANGIYDEASYLSLGSELPSQLRNEAELFRYHSMIDTVDKYNPVSLLSILPSHLLTLHVNKFSFSARVENVLNAQSVDSLAGLQGITLNTMLKWTNFGQGSVKSLCDSVINYVDKLSYESELHSNGLEGSISISADSHVDSDARRLEAVSFVPLKEHFEKTLAELKARDRLVIEHRTGMFGSIKTLEEVGNLLNVTRERVRQIQSKYIKKIINAELWDDCIAIKIGQLLIDRKEPLFLEMLEIEDSWFKGFIGNYQNLSAIIELFSENEIRVIKINGTNVISRIKQDDWLDLVSQMRKWLRVKADEGGWTRSDIEMTFEAALLEKTSMDLLPLLWEEFSGALQFGGEEKDAKLISFGKTAEAAISAVLHKAEKPLHYSEIAERATELLGKKVDERRAHNGAPAQGAKLFGRGIYGLERLNPIPDRMCDNIRLVVDRMICQGELKKQWHCSEILAQLQRQFPALPKDLDHYVLNMILERSDRLSYLNRMVWARADSGQNKDDRIDMADAFTKILEDHGSPLKGVALKEKLRAIRGVPEHLQIQPTDRMILVGPDLWGLIDRDVNIDEEARLACLAALYEHLDESQKGVHVSEVDTVLTASNIFPVPDSYTLLNVAQRDSRFYLARAMFLGLSEWGEDVRRLNFTQAVRKLVREMVSPMSIGEINARVEDITGLSVDGSVTGILINEGGRYDAEKKLWVNSTLCNK